MCGSSKSQNTVNSNQIQLQQQQLDFNKQLMDQYQKDFAQNQAVLKSLTDTLQPIIKAGASQQGFSPAETAALNTQAAESAARTYRDTSTAANEEMAARGGGNSFIPSGAQEQVNAGIGVQAENQLANDQLGITEASYGQGQKNYDFAIGALSGAPGALEGATNGTANAVSGSGNAAANAGSAAASEANSINQSNNSWLGVLGGVAGGLAGDFSFKV